MKKMRCKFNRKQILIIFDILLFILLFEQSLGSSFQSNFENISNSSKSSKEFLSDQKITSLQSPKSADISGNELYAEQIAVDISGNRSLIQQSFFTNDTNIFSGIDLSDPAFNNAVFMISASNQLPSPMDPNPRTSEKLDSIHCTYNGFQGFLYYNPLNSNKSKDRNYLTTQKEHAMNYLRDLLQMDLIEYDSIEDPEWGYFYPFYSAEPEWRTYFTNTLSNIPQDGYWKAFNYERLSSEKYLSTSHLSSTMLFFKNYSKSFNLLDNISTIPIHIDFDLAQSQNFLQNSLLNGTTNENSDGTTSTTGFPSTINGIGNNNQEDNNSALESISNTMIYSVQYEGIENSIIKDPSLSDTYDFDLFKSLNYSQKISGPLTVSEKTFNSMNGVMLSTINIGLYSAEVTSITPEFFNIDQEYINRIEDLLFLFNEDIDLSELKDLSFKIQWKNEGLYSRMITLPQNLNNQSDYINLLSLVNNLFITNQSLGMTLPGAMIEPITHFNFSYIILPEEPSLIVEKRIISGNASRILEQNQNPEVELLIQNLGSLPVWGLERNLSTLGISNDPLQERNLGQLQGNFFDLLGYDSNQINDITTTLGYNLEDLFSDDNPRFIMIDSNSSGIIDLTFPALLNLAELSNIQDQSDLLQLSSVLTRIFPYSPKFTQLLIDNPDAYGQIANNPQIFNSTDSIFNPNNWEIDPGKNITISLGNFASGVNSTYQSFQSLYIAQIQDVSPVFVYGSELYTTHVDATYSKDDGQSWICGAQQIGNSYQIEQYLVFQNFSSPLEQQHNLDAIQILMDFIPSLNDTSLSLEIFNYETQTFTTIPNVYSTNNPGVVNNTIENGPVNFFINYNITNFIDPENSNSLLVRTTFENTQDFEVSIDFFQINKQDLNNSRYSSNPSIVIYGTETSNNQYKSTSNGFIYSTDDSASLTSIIDLNQTQCQIGDSLMYNLTLTNWGNLNASQISISIPSPGILLDQGNFSINENKSLNFSIFRLSPGESISNLTFTFKILNSLLIPSTEITWNEYNLDGNQNRTFSTQSNRIYISAPINYALEGHRPAFNQLSIRYLSNFVNEPPTINSNFTTKIEIMNKGNFASKNIDIPLIQNITGIQLLNESHNILIDTLNPNQKISYELKYRKLSFSGYMLPSLFLNCSQKNRISYCYPSKILILGSFGLQITKNFDKLDAIKREIIEINITVSNTGNIALGNLSINDLDGYDAKGFILYQGVQIFDVPLLKPGEIKIFSYKIKALQQQGSFWMNPTKVKYWFIEKQICQTQPVQFKIRNSPLLTNSLIFLPIIMGSLSIFLTYKYKMQYHREDLEMERRETLFFGQDLRETSWHKKNLQEFMDDNIKLEKGEKI